MTTPEPPALSTPGPPRREGRGAAWLWRGLGRRAFAAWALGLFLLKVSVDRVLLHWLGEPAIPLPDYFLRAFPGADLWTVAANPWAAGILLAASLPFLALGCGLCLRRLRTAGLPGGLVVLFVVPVLKWFLFVLAGLAPDRSGEGTARFAAGGWGWRRWLPDSAWGSAVMAMGMSGGVALLVAVVGTEAMKSYGWALFAGAPFALGFLAAALHSARCRRTWLECVVVAELAAGLVGVGFLAFALEGVLCLVMAAPLAGALAALGGLLAYLVQDARETANAHRVGFQCLTPLIAMPLMLGTEALREGPPPLLRVTTAVEIAAPPTRVWHHVVSFGELPPPTEAIFRLGIAYPLRAEIRGTGVGAVRHCVFSTGPFVEPIEVWDEPRLLAFSVTENPAPMEEWTPYRRVHPPHLEGFLVSRRGQFRLEPLPGGGTRLEGTTWYHHSLWPAAYWQVWSDAIIHAIHRRVLDHVRRLAEGDAGWGPVQRLGPFLQELRER